MQLLAVVQLSKLQLSTSAAVDEEVLLHSDFAGGQSGSADAHISESWHHLCPGHATAEIYPHWLWILARIVS